MLEKKTASKVEKGEILAYIHSNDEAKKEEIIEDVKNAYKIVEKPVDSIKHIIGII